MHLVLSLVAARVPVQHPVQERQSPPMPTDIPTDIPMDQALESLDALVVLGCRVRGERPSHTLAERLEMARRLVQRGRDRGASAFAVVVSGGRTWSGHREADVMAAWLLARGVEERRILCERESETTIQNARCVARLLGSSLATASLATPGRYRTLGLVTSDFHLKRAVRLFEKEGFTVVPFSATSTVSAWTKKRLAIREWGAALLARFQRT